MKKRERERENTKKRMNKRNVSRKLPITYQIIELFEMKPILSFPAMHSSVVIVCVDKREWIFFLWRIMLNKMQVSRRAYRPALIFSIPVCERVPCARCSRSKTCCKSEQIRQSSLKFVSQRRRSCSGWRPNDILGGICNSNHTPIGVYLHWCTSNINCR